MKDEPKLKFWYETPMSLSLDGWEKYDTFIKKNYPIQYFFRDTIPDIWNSYVVRPSKKLYWKVFRFFNPCHKDIRRAIPREWNDISHLIVEVNFAMIKSFKEEADGSYVDWEWNEAQSGFKKWLDESYNYITVVRPLLQKRQMNAYPPLGQKSSKPYEELYGEVDRLEKLIEEKDTEILKQMITYREYMWT